MKRTMLALVVATTLVGGLAGCAPIRDSYAERPADVYGAVTGTVMMLTRQALPPETVIEVALLDDSGASPAPAILGQTTADPQSGGLPLAFTLTYRRAALQDGHTYLLRATVSDAGKTRLLAEQPVVLSAVPAPPLAVGNVILRPAP